MQLYKDPDGMSGIQAFSIGKEYIKIKFKTGQVYLYDYTNPGKTNVEEMKRLARDGIGLTTYINRFVRERYAERLV